MFNGLKNIILSNFDSSPCTNILCKFGHYTSLASVNLNNLLLAEIRARKYYKESKQISLRMKEDIKKILDNIFKIIFLFI